LSVGLDAARQADDLQRRLSGCLDLPMYVEAQRVEISSQVGAAVNDGIAAVEDLLDRAYLAMVRT